MEQVKLNERLEAHGRLLDKYILDEKLAFADAGLGMSNFTEIAIRKAYTAGMLRQLEDGR